MGHDAQNYGPRALGHRGEIRRRQGEAHAEHDDAQQEWHAWRQRLEGIRKQETGHAGKYYEEGKDRDRDPGDFGFRGQCRIQDGGFDGVGCCLKHLSIVAS